MNMESKIEGNIAIANWREKLSTAWHRFVENHIVESSNSPEDLFGRKIMAVSKILKMDPFIAGAYCFDLEKKGVDVNNTSDAELALQIETARKIFYEEHPTLFDLAR